MPFGAVGHIGIGKETTFGTAVAASDYLQFVSEGINREIEQLVSAAQRAIYDESPSYEGGHTITGDLTAEVYPNAIGYLLRAAFGAPVTTQPDASGSPTVYQHVFTPVQTNFSTDCPLPPYTLEVHRDLASAFQYAGVNVNELNFSFGTDNKIMTVTASIIAKVLALISKTSPSFETTDPFLWNQATVTIGGSQNNDLQTLTFGIQNALEGRMTLNGAKTISRIRRNGKRTFPVSFTLELSDLTEYNRFASQSEVAASIDLTGADIDGSYNYQMTIDLPALRYTAFPINVGGSEVITAQVTGDAKYDADSAYAMKITIINTQSSY